MRIDEIDRQLIELLRANARVSVAGLAQSLGLARSTVQARLERLETSGAIEGYTIRLGVKARARPIRATALLQIEPRSLPAVLSRLKGVAAVEAVHTTSGRFDLVVELASHTTEDLDASLDEIGGVTGVRSSESLIHLSTRLDRR